MQAAAEADQFGISRSPNQDNQQMDTEEANQFEEDYYSNFARRLYELAERENWDAATKMKYFNDRPAFEKYYTNVSKPNKSCTSEHANEGNLSSTEIAIEILKCLFIYSIKTSSLASKSECPRASSASCWTRSRATSSASATSVQRKSASVRKTSASFKSQRCFRSREDKELGHASLTSLWRIK